MVSKWFGIIAIVVILGGAAAILSSGLSPYSIDEIRTIIAKNIEPAKSDTLPSEPAATQESAPKPIVSETNADPEPEILQDDKPILPTEREPEPREVEPIVVESEKMPEPAIKAEPKLENKTESKTKDEPVPTESNSKETPESDTQPATEPKATSEPRQSADAGSEPAATPPTQSQPQAQRDDAYCDRLIAQLIDPNLTQEKVAMIIADLKENNCELS